MRIQAGMEPECPGVSVDSALVHSFSNMYMHFSFVSFELSFMIIFAGFLDVTAPVKGRLRALSLFCFILRFGVWQVWGFGDSS